MPLFGNNNPPAPPLMGGGTPTAAVADATGATASSPFLRYMQENAGAAKSTAQALLGEAPKPDYSAALLQAGLGILGAPTGGPPLQAIAQGAQTAIPAFMQEKQRVNDYEKQVQTLATQLGLKDFEVMQKLSDPGDDIAEAGGVVYSKRRYKEAFAETGDVVESFKDATVLNKKGTKAEYAEQLAKLETNLEMMKHQPDVDEAEIAEAQREIDYLRMQIEPQDPAKQPMQVFVQDADGRITSIQGQPGDIGPALIEIGDQKEMRRLETKQRATDQTLGYVARTLDILDNASLASSGKLGGLASSGAAWGKAITEGLDGPRAGQFKSEVGANPADYLQQLANDPEAENYLSPGLIDRLSEIGQENAQLLSNIIGLGYATARASDEGGRLSNSDVAFALQRIGYDLDSFLNDPAAVRAGILELGSSTVRDYEGSLALKENGEKLVERDYLLNKRLKEYGFNWSGGAKGLLTYGEDPAKPADRDPAEPKAAKPTQAPQVQDLQTDQTSGLPQVQTEAQYSQLPSGAKYVAPDGTIRTKK